jgi:alcohol dehydrogenase class IV
LKKAGKEDVESMAKDAYAFKPNMNVNPRPMELEDIIHIYEDAYEGNLRLD